MVLYEKTYFFLMFLFFSFFYLVPQDVQYIITEAELTELEKILQDLKMSNKTLQTNSQSLTMQVKRLKRMLKKKEAILSSLKESYKKYESEAEGIIEAQKTEIEAKQKKISRLRKAVIALSFLILFWIALIVIFKAKLFKFF